MSTQYFTLPTSVADSLRCSMCQNYLSCGPITRQKETQKIICGRCVSPINSISEFLYEQAMTSFVFPCSYDDKGCAEKILFNNVNEHELNCKYRWIQCPVADCMQSLSQKLIKHHFEERHTDLIKKNGSNLDLYNENLVSYIMIIENDVTTIFGYCYDWNENLLKIKTGYVNKNDDQTVNYKVQLVKPNGLSSDLVYNSCSVYKYPMEQEADLFLENVFFDTTHDGYNVCIKLKIHSDKTRKSALAVLPVTKFIKDDDEIEAKAIHLMSKLNDIICKNCKCIIIPPIYQRISISTSKKFFYCEKCVSWYTSNGYVCTKIERAIDNYPCKWKGCSVISTDKTIKEHIDTCKFKKHICLFCKPETDFLISKDSMLCHLQNHAEYFLNPDNIRIDLYNLNNKIETNYYFAIFENKIVYFTCKLLSKKSWSFCCQFEEGIQIFVTFEHDHCRLRALENSYKKELTIGPEDITFPECFYSYNRLRVILRVESYIPTQPE